MRRAAAELALSSGWGGATFDAIAKRAEVSRTTIYRWWSSPAAIVLEGLLDALGDSINRPAGSTVKEALGHYLRSLNAILADTASGPLLHNVVAAGAADPEVSTAVLEQWLTPRRAVVVALLREAVDGGEIHPDTDIEATVDLLVSPPYYRLIFGLPPLDQAALERVLDTVWRGVSAARE